MPQSRVKSFKSLSEEEKKKHTFDRRTKLRQIEKKVQAKWKAQKVYEEAAPVEEASKEEENATTAPVTVSKIEGTMRADGKTPDANSIAFTLGYLAGRRERENVESAAATVATEKTERKKKYFCTFPYPYMNGRIHLGHAFTITKAEFAARYHRLKGDKVLFPFAFHCTGMPIQGSANKLKDEIAAIGLENCRKGIFDLSIAASDTKPANSKTTDDADDADKVGIFKGKKTKLVAKTGKKTTWEILLACGVDPEEIPKFVDAKHWLRYFPPIGQSDLEVFGLNTDWRRSFITTDINPYYNSFIEWQFRQLRKSGKVKFGNRPTIYSPLDGQACGDHARSDGEGVGPQQYTLIKIRVLEPEKLSADFKGANVFMVAATLRPETMHGQTNCFVLPDGTYAAYDVVEPSSDGKKTSKATEIFICSEHSARNMAFQDFFCKRGDWKTKRGTFTGRQLLGLALKAPNCKYDKVYSLPLLTIKMDKGTGIVTSVPSDAPDDYMALKDLQRDAKLREEYGITESMVDFDVVPIISIPGGDPDLKIDDFKNMAAATACIKMNIKDQHDKAKLAKAKKRVYLKGFESGVMLVGAFKGESVKHAKEKERKKMIADGDAREYWEPENLVVSRTQDKCVVAYLDQWYLTYGTPEWRDVVKNHVKNPDTFETYGDSARNQYMATLDWMQQWACSRSFGLGTKLPWDKKFIIESLSDSTIYMSYYTVAHMLQGPDNMDGSKIGPAGIRPEQMTDDVWSFIFLGAPLPEKCGIERDLLEKMRSEFEFWYPMDLRVSGKDLIRNHLTMALYNHAAIWADRKEMWPKSYFTNGHVMVDAQKMSKSKGNFITLLNATSSDNMYYKLEKEDISHDAVTKCSVDESGELTDKVPEFLEENQRVEFKTKKGEIFTGKIVKAPKKASGKAKKGGGGKKKMPKYQIEHEKKGCWVAQSWSVDTVRLALGDAGDSMEDANFDSEVANQCILRLTKELDWVQECVVDGKHRSDVRTIDNVFLLKMQECIREADEAYANMQFKSAIVWAFYTMFNIRDDYRNYHGMSGEPMNGDVLRKFVNALVVMIAPITPHWSEHVWTEILGNKGTVVRASWPSYAKDVEALNREVVLRRSEYVATTVHSFRSRMAPPKKKKKKKGVEPPQYVKPNAAYAFVRRKYEPWRATMVQKLRSLRNSEGTFDKTAMKSFLVGVRESDVLKSANPKILKKATAFAIKKVNEGFKTYLDDSLPFDETEVLKESRGFIMKSLNLETFEIFDHDKGPDVPARRDAAPEAPAVHGYKK
eukprot:g3252.t1